MRIGPTPKIFPVSDLPDGGNYPYFWSEIDETLSEVPNKYFPKILTVIEDFLVPARIHDETAFFSRKKKRPKNSQKWPKFDFLSDPSLIIGYPCHSPTN